MDSTNRLSKDSKRKFAVRENEDGQHKADRLSKDSKRKSVVRGREKMPPYYLEAES
jgi:hypothetical protein